jgi:seryl-tRNA synthetase
MEKNFELNDTAIMDLIKYGTMTKEVKLNDKVTIYLKNLTQEDRVKYSKLINIKSDKEKNQDEALFELIESSKVPVLLYAITKINDIDFSTDESKTTLKQLLLKFPPTVIDKIYDAHIENENTLIATFNNEELKKN